MKKKYVVTVPVVLHLEVYSPDEKFAHWEAVQAERWMLQAVNFCMADEEDDLAGDVPPENFLGYRVMVDFEKATTMRGSLDLYSKEWQEPAALLDGVQSSGVNRNVTSEPQAGEEQP